MSDDQAITDALNDMRALVEDQSKKMASIPSEVHQRRLSNMPVLAACFQAMMEVPCEREVAEQFGLTLTDFMRHFADSLVVPILVGKKRLIAGAMWFKDGEVHLAVKREHRSGKWVTRLEELFAPGFEAFGPVLTARVNRKNLVARRFTERIGGTRVGEDELAHVYELHKDKMIYWTHPDRRSDTPKP